MGAPLALAGKHLWDKYKAREVAANEAKERVRAQYVDKPDSVNRARITTRVQALRVTRAQALRISDVA